MRGVMNSHDVDPRALQRLHALVMVVPRVDRVDADRVDAELLEVGHVARAV